MSAKQALIVLTVATTLTALGCANDSAGGQDPATITQEQLSGTWQLTKINPGDNQLATASRDNFDAILTLNANGAFSLTEWQNGIQQDSSGQLASRFTVSNASNSMRAKPNP